jgi:hypothetical protein
MSNVHILPDENLGGGPNVQILREYVEVNRRAKVGDKIVIVRPEKGSAYEKGDIFTVEKSYENHPEFEDGVEVEEDFYFIYHSEYHTLEPTDIVRLREENGVEKRYRLVYRKAKVGEKVIVVEGFAYGKVGEIHTIKEVYRDVYTTDKASIMRFGRCLVLEPVEPTELVTAEEGDDKSVIDLLANLARRVTELERKLGEYARKIDGIEADIQNINVDLGTVEENVEMALGDIVTLDERTQPLVTKKPSVAVAVKSIQREFAGAFTKTEIDAYVAGEGFCLNGTFEFKGGVKGINDAAEKISEVFK